jgi:hypothetical protein
LALKTPPELGSYKYVLRTIRAYDPELERTAHAYEEVLTSRDITHPDGVRHPTIFVVLDNTRERMVRDGWEDVSEQWFRHHTPAAVPPRVRIKA